MRHIFDDETISAYVDGRCSEDISAKLKGHIEKCAVCREKVAHFKLAKKMLGNLEEIEVPEGFDFEFNRRLNEAIAERKKIGAIERVAQQILEGVRITLTEPAPVLAKVAISILMLAILAVGAPYYFAKSPISVASISGDVEVYSHRDQEWIKAAEGMALSKNDIVKTGLESQIDITSNGLFTVRVKGDAELKTLVMLPRFRKGSISYEVTKGEILVDITKKFEGSRFEVYTPQAVAKTHGTRFAMDISGVGKENKTWLGVTDGIVEVMSRYPIYVAGEEKVLVRAGEKTEVLYNMAPLSPSLLLAIEWNKLKELYQIGRTPQAVLFISATETRVRELLKPCSMYIYDVEPRTISKRLEKAVENIQEAIAEENVEKHLEAIKELELIVKEDPEREYNSQLLLFIGTYYSYISQYDKAVETFERAIEKYPHSQFASLAKCAIGIIYNEKLGEKVSARKVFESLILNYPNSLEALEAKKAINGDRHLF